MPVFRYLLLAGALALSSPLLAQTAQLDSGFDGDGVAALAGLLVDPELCCAAPTAGGWLVAGDAQLTVAGRESREPFVLKLRLDGSPDPTFGVFGLAFPALSDRVGDGATGYRFRVHDLHVDPEGRILLAGATEFTAAAPRSTGAGYLIRLNANGVLDTGFDGGVVWARYAPDDPELDAPPQRTRTPLFAVGSFGQGEGLRYRAHGHRSSVINSVTNQLGSWGTLLAIDRPETADPAHRSLINLAGLSEQGHALNSWNGDILDTLSSGNKLPFLKASPGVLPSAAGSLTPDLQSSVHNRGAYLHWAALPDRGFYAARPQNDASLIRLQPTQLQGELVFQRQPTGLNSTRPRSLAVTATGSLWRTEELNTSLVALVGPDDVQRDTFAAPFAAPQNGVDGRLVQAVHFDSVSALSLIGFGEGNVLHFRQYRIAEPPVPLFDTLPAALADQSVSGVPRNSWVVSDPFQVLGIDASPSPEYGVRVPASVDVGELRVNGGDWQRGIALVRFGDRIEVRHRSSAQAQTSTVSVLSVGGALGARSRAFVIGERRFVQFTSTTATATVDSGSGCGASGASHCPGSIPDNALLAPLRSTRQVLGCELVSSIHLALEISHPRVADLRIGLQTPAAGYIELIDGSTLAGCGADLAVRFDEQGAAAVSANCRVQAPALLGAVRPVDPLQSALGSAGNGSWQLVLSDVAAGSSGSLQDWSLHLGCASAIDPPDVTDLTVRGFNLSPSAPSAGETLSLITSAFRKGLESRALPRVGASLELFRPGGSLPLPMGTGDGLASLAWRCTLEGGGPVQACPLPSHCAGWPCTARPIAVETALRADDEIVFVVDAQLAPGYAAPQVELEQRVDGLIDFAGGRPAPLEVDPRDNRARDAVFLQHRADVAVASLTLGGSVDAPWVDIELSNAGPARSAFRRIGLDLPTGYSLLSLGCVPGSETQCPALPESNAFFRIEAGEVLRARAQLSRSGGNGGLLQVQLSAPLVDTGATDPVAANNSRSIALTAPPSGDTIFANGFE